MEESTKFIYLFTTSYAEQDVAPMIFFLFKRWVRIRSFG